MHDKFLKLIKQHSEDLQMYSSTFNIIGYIKLSLIALMGVIIYLMFRNNFALAYSILFISTIVLSVGFWVYHTKLSKKIEYIKGIIAIYKRQISRINGQWVNFKDIGSELIDSHHAYACDLDIVGKKSLFQLLNTTQTWHGRQALANDLLRPTFNKLELEKRQEATQELSRDDEISCKAQYYLSKIGIDPSTPALIDCLKNNTAFCENRVYRALLSYIPVLTFLFIVGIMVFQQSHLYIIGAVIAVFQFMVWVWGASKTQVYLSTLARLPYKLGAYNDVIDLLVKHNFASEKLVLIQAKLKEADFAIKDLGKISDKIKLRYNAVLYFLANTFLLWDYYCAFLLQDWKYKYTHLAEEWFLAVGEFESMLSFSHLPNICDNVSLPSIEEKIRIIEAKDIGHPLLPNERRVNNDFSIGDNILIVSGSNMSGKTTFLRTVGINIILARAGGFVCAKEMRLSVFDVATSMRLADDLNEGVSTFYAELKRIKMIIDMVETEPNIIFLIDEIFRGTNSVDRLAGARSVIAKLDVLNAIGLLSTHDLELCELENFHERIKNYSFCEHYNDSKLSFDYKITELSLDVVQYMG